MRNLPHSLAERRRRRIFLAALCLLALAPVAALIRPLAEGAIPWFMDPLMYFFPLRIHAARLMHGGELPLWNRGIMCGMPLLENPQSALFYPGVWPVLAWPGGFWFTFPLVFQIGLYAALTAWGARLIGAQRGVAIWAGAIALAGGYALSRLQYGNYLNVMPWWGLWLGAAWAFRRGGSRRWLAAGAAAVALMIIGGAHQIAAYFLISTNLMTWTLMATDRPGRRRWLIFWLLTHGVGTVAAAIDWLPAVSFIMESGRPEGVGAEAVLAGTIGGWRELVGALAGPWGIWRAGIGEGPWADAEAAYWIGPLALALAAVAPARPSRRRAWLACWMAASLCIFLSLRPVMAALLELTPAAGIFHGPRRWLGVGQWWLIVAAALGATGLAERLSLRERAWQVAPPLVLLLALAAGMMPGLTHVPAFAATFALASAAGLLLLMLGNRWRRSPVMRPAMLILAVAVAGHMSWTLIERAWLPADQLLNPDNPPLLTKANLKPGERFFSLDWHRAWSYDYRRPDLLDWLPPNLGMLYGLESLDGYEPAMSKRMRALQSPRQPFNQHLFLLNTVNIVQGRFVGRGTNSLVRAANVKAALVPRWGSPLFFTPVASDIRVTGHWFWFSRPDHVLAFGPAGSEVEIGLWNQGSFVPYKAFSLAALTASDDLYAPPAQYTGNRPEPPGSGAVKSARIEYDPPLLTPLPNAVRAAPGVEIIDVFWGDMEWQRGWWKPIAMSAITVLLQGQLERSDWAGGEGITIDRKDIRANRIRIEISIEKEGWTELGIGDAWWPGWKATLDGREIELAGGEMFRNIELREPGRHIIEMRYWPVLMTPALIIGGLGWLAICILAWRRDGNANPERV